VLCCSVRSFALHDKSPRSRAASGGRLQEEPRPAPCEAGLVRAKERADAEGSNAGKDLKTIQRNYSPPFTRSGRNWRGSLRTHEAWQVRILRPVFKLNCAEVQRSAREVW